MLDLTLNTPFIPGTNLNGDLACADWRFLLPRLSYKHILFIGKPHEGDLQVMHGMSPLKTVITTREHKEKKLAKLNSGTLAGTTFLPMPSPGDNFSIYEESVDLMVLADLNLYKKHLSQKATQNKIAKALRTDAAIFIDVFGLSQRFTARRLFKRYARHGFGLRAAYWLTPFRGDLRTAAPIGRGKISGYLFSNVLYGQSVKKRIISFLGKIAAPLRIIDLLAPRRAYLLSGKNPSSYTNEMPDFLKSMAPSSGDRGDSDGLALSARGKYNANKVIYFLFAQSKSRPDSVLKITRSPEFNFRLENEYNILSELRAKKYVPQASYPRAQFLAYENNLAVIGLDAVKGVPFRVKTTAAADCPYTRKTINWIIQLGMSSQKSTTDSAECYRALRSLYENFSKIYSLTPFERDFLLDQLDTVRNYPGKIPTVLQHGDPGTWNILVSDSDEIIVLDWEAGELNGVPLWDLLYFFRTFSSWIGRSMGVRNPLSSFENLLLRKTALHDLFDQTIKTYCRSVNLDSRLVPPLFHTCWMHRALKEATRLHPQNVSAGHYVNLLKQCIASPLAAAYLQSFDVVSERKLVK